MRQNVSLAECRERFNSDAWSGSGKIGQISDYALTEMLVLPNRLNVLDDLIGYTGLTRPEVMKRLRREGVYHYHSEHTFWDPQSTTELTWFYRHSVDYLFGLAWHPVEKILAGRFKPEHGPVVELAPGVGQNGIFLASHNVRQLGLERRAMSHVEPCGLCCTPLRTNPDSHSPPSYGLLADGGRSNMCTQD